MGEPLNFLLHTVSGARERWTRSKFYCCIQTPNDAI